MTAVLRDLNSDKATMNERLINVIACVELFFWLQLIPVNIVTVRMPRHTGVYVPILENSKSYTAEYKNYLYAINRHYYADRRLGNDSLTRARFFGSESKRQEIFNILEKLPKYSGGKIKKQKVPKKSCQ